MGQSRSSHHSAGVIGRLSKRCPHTRREKPGSGSKAQNWTTRAALLIPLMRPSEGPTGREGFELEELLARGLHVE